MIVPVYNNENRLDRCVSSLIEQTYKKLQIILVDDGSDDKSGEICDQWAKKDSRIVVIHKTNGGVGTARNAGLDVAVGKYIAFVDSDDYIADKMYELLVSEAEKNHAEQVCCNLYNVFQNQKNQENHYFGDTIIQGKEQVLSELIIPLLTPEQAGKKAKLLQSPCNKMYLRDVIRKNEVKFDTTLPYAEDWLFNVNYYRFIKKVVFVSEPLYFYDRTTEQSLSKTFQEQGFDNSVKIRKFQREWFPDVCTDEIYNNLIMEIQLHYLNLYVSYYGYKGLKRYTTYLYHNESLCEVYKRIQDVPVKFRIAKKCFEYSGSCVCELLYYMWSVFNVSINAIKYYIKRVLKKIKRRI